MRLLELAVLSVLVFQIASGTRLIPDENRMFELYQTNVFVVDMRKHDQPSRPLTLKCQSRPNALDLKFSFSGLNTKVETLPAELINVPGIRELKMSFPAPIQGSYTGRYNCTARYENNRVETVSWYIYFYPNTQELFLKCPLFDELKRCLLSYRAKEPFKVPCRALHPEIIVSDTTRNSKRNFNYNPELGFFGELTGDQREFECSAVFGGISEIQRYELSRISYMSKVEMLPPKSIDFIRIDKDTYKMPVIKSMPLNLTCVTQIGCNDYNYALRFITNTTDKYTEVVNPSDRTKCSMNFNELFVYSKSMLIDHANTNYSNVQCEVAFGTELKTLSANYVYIVSDEAFLNFGKNSTAVDYTSAMVDIVQINLYFEASSAFRLLWYRNNLRMDIPEYVSGKNNPQPADAKYLTSCLKKSLYSYECFLQYLQFSDKDTGDHIAEISLIENPEKSIKLNVTVIMPKKPELFILPPKFCSQFWTCETDKRITLQLNAQAHMIDLMFIYVIECKNLDECYSYKKNDHFIQNIVAQVVSINGDPLLDSDLQTSELTGTKLPSITVEFDPRTGRILNKLISNSDSSWSSFDEKYSLVRDEDKIRPSNGGVGDDKFSPQVQTPTEFERMEMIESSLLWSYKTRLDVKKHYLVIYYAENEFDKVISTRLIVPSELERGKPFNIGVVGERERDDEIVEGDSFRLQYGFNNVVFNNRDYKIVALPESQSCGLKPSGSPSTTDGKVTSSVDNGNALYTDFVYLNFKNVTSSCNFNYSMLLAPKKHPYLEEQLFQNLDKSVYSYSVNVLSPIKPYFIHDNLNKTVVVNDTLSGDDDGQGTNGTNIEYVTTEDIRVDSDTPFVLNCDYYGRPRPNIQWLMKGQPVNLTDEKYKIVGNGSLKLIRPHPSDSGEYECIVTNRVGRLSRTFNVDVDASAFTQKVNEMTQKQKIIIITTSVIAFILALLLVLALTYVILQKKEHKDLKTKHKKLLDFLNINGDNEDLDTEMLINTKLENLEKMKFDDEHWQIMPVNFIVHHSQVLGQGNFGKVCLATVASSQLRDETQAKKDLSNFFTSADGAGPDGGAGGPLARRGSTKRQNLYLTKNADLDETSIPLLPADARKVAVKMVKDQKVNSPNIDLLLQELKIMGYLGHHVNIIQLIGCCTNYLVSDGIVYVFVEYCPNGDLKNWLRANHSKYSQVNNDNRHSLVHELRKRLSTMRIGSGSDQTSSQLKDFKFNDDDLVFFGYQIAKGMEYLSRKRFLHRDLAARNILLGEHFECKISDFGLADESKLSSQSYFGRVKNMGVPIKWTAPEALLEQKYEANSDVWSFGIVLWEIFTLGLYEPYPLIPNKEFLQHIIKIKNGEQPPLPENGSDKIHDIMRECWTVNHANRPTFHDLVPKFEHLLGDNYKQYYDMLNERFRAQLTRDKQWKRDTQQPRDSGQLKPANQPAQPAAANPQPTPTYVNQPAAPNYIRIPIKNEQSNQQNSNRYLEPANNSSSYLEPQTSPQTRPQLQPDNSYLEPSNRPVLSRHDDTYSGSNYDNSGYMKPVNEKRMAPKAPRTTTQMDTYGGPEDGRGTSIRTNASTKPIEYIDKTTDEADTYLLPRLQDTPQGTVISTYGAAPAKNPVTRADFPRTSPSYYYNQKYRSVNMAPPPPPPPTAPYPIRDQPSYKNVNATETDV